jgi:hypothetical protein
MSLDANVREELRRRGAAAVRALLDNPEWTGRGQAADVKLDLAGVPNPTRAAVEAWLREQERAADVLAKQRHDEQLAAARESTRWGRNAFWAAAASVLVGLLALVLGLLK